MRRIGNHDCHELAEAFDLMDERALESLAESISMNGQRRPIMLLDGLILDGRNRYLACLLAKVEPKFEDYAGDDPVQYVWDENGERRDLSVTQRILALKRLETLRRRMKQPNKNQRRLDLADPADKENLATLKRLGCDELLSAHDSGLIGELSHAAELAKLPAGEQREEVRKLQQYADREPQRATAKARSVFVVRETSDGTIDSVWTHKERADQVAQGLRDELRMSYIVDEFELNAIDGAVV